MDKILIFIEEAHIYITFSSKSWDDQKKRNGKNGDKK